MALIVETGAIVTDANSFVTDVEYTTYANARGLTVDALAANREQHLIKAMDYILSRESEMLGVRVGDVQELPYPRYQVQLFGYLVPSDFIPRELKRAQMEAAVAATGNDILSNVIETNVRTEKLGDMEIEYFGGGEKSNANLKRVNAQLSHLLNSVNNLVRA